MKLLLLYWGIVSGGLLCPGTLWSQTLALEPVLSGLASPLYVTNAHDGSGRLFILEQEGWIRVLQPGATIPTLFLMPPGLELANLKEEEREIIVERITRCSRYNLAGCVKNQDSATLFVALFSVP